MKRSWNLSFAIMVLCQFLAQDGPIHSGSAESAQDPLQQRIESFSSIDKTGPFVIQDLNRVSFLPINAVLGDIDRHANVLMKDVPLQALLDELALQMGWSWRRKPGSIEIVDTGFGEDVDHPFKVRLDSFRYDGGNATHAVDALISRPELINRRYYVIFFSSRPRAVTETVVVVNLNDVTPVDVLDAIVEADGHLFWEFHRAQGANVLNLGERRLVKAPQ